MTSIRHVLDLLVHIDGFEAAPHDRLVDGIVGFSFCDVELGTEVAVAFPSIRAAALNCASLLSTMRGNNATWEPL
jgi:hypothetical protein